MAEDWKGRLRKARNDKGLSQEALGELVGLSQTAIYSYEKGPNQVDIPTLLKLARALDVTPEWIAFNHICPQAEGSPDDLDRVAVRAAARAMSSVLIKLDTHLSPEKFAANLVGFAEQHRGDSPEAITAHVENYLAKSNENVGFLRDPR